MLVRNTTIHGNGDSRFSLFFTGFEKTARLLKISLGLSAGERECIEASYRKGYLDVLCATSTLALGVNLPAARVIIRAPHVGLTDKILDICG